MTICDTGRLLFNIGGFAEQLGFYNVSPCFETEQFRLRRSESVTVADCDISTCRGFDRVSGVLPGLFAKVIFPLSGVVVVFADNLGGLTSSARLLARYLRFTPIIEVQPPPLLIVISQKQVCTERDFGRMLTSELICVLRQVQPESPRSFHQANQMWASRVHGMRMIHKSPLLARMAVLHNLEEAAIRRENGGFGLSTLRFQQLLTYAINAALRNFEPPFNILEAIGVRLPSWSYARIALQNLIDSVGDENIDQAAIAASCISYYAFNTEAYVSHVGLVNEYVESRLLHGHRHCRTLSARIRHYLRGLVERHQSREQSLVSQHLQLMRASRIRLPGCSFCLFNVPMHKLTCGHFFCECCVRQATSGQIIDVLPSTKRCFLCDKVNINAITLTSSKIRVLILSGHSSLILEFLSEIRALLYGHLEEYFDHIVASSSVSTVIIDYFCLKYSLPQCSRILKASGNKFNLFATTRMVPTSRLPVAIVDGSQLHRTYGNDPQIRFTGLPSYLKRRLLQNKSMPLAPVMPDIVDQECQAIWGPVGWSRLEYHGAHGVIRDAKLMSGKLLAGLFYVEICRVPKTNISPVLLELELKCVLAPGAHLNAVMHAFLEHNAILHYSCSQSRLEGQLCTRSMWAEIIAQDSKQFSKRIEIEAPSLDCSLELKVDNIHNQSLSEHIKNSPCIVSDIIALAWRRPSTDRADVQLPRYIDVKPQSSGEQGGMPNLEHQIGHLEKLLSQWK